MASTKMPRCSMSIGRQKISMTHAWLKLVVSFVQKNMIGWGLLLQTAIAFPTRHMLI